MKYTNQNKGKCLNLKVITDSNGYVVAKWCNKCYQYLDVDSFDWDNTNDGYLFGWCINCIKINSPNIES